MAVPFRFQVRKNARQQISPFALPGRRRNFIVANLDHHAWQTTRTRVAFERMVDAVGGRIWFVVADNHAIQDAERGNERRRQPAVLIVEHPDMPWPRHLFVDRSERVNGNQPCVAPLRKPVRDDRVDFDVKRFISQCNAPGAILICQPRIAGDKGRLADRRNEIRRIERPVAPPSLAI